MNIEEFKTECQAFIFSWHKVSQNAKKLQKQFSDLGIETYVINSHEAENNNGLPNWINIGESGYMVQQYAKAIETFNKQFFIEMFADIYEVNAKLIIKRACYVFNKYNCGVYAPNVDYIEWVFDKKRIPKLEKNLYEVKNAESLLSFIHKDVLKGVVLDTEKYKIGWGIDFLVCILAFLKKRLVIRDYITTIKHPRGRGYNNSQAEKEFEQFINDLDENISILMKPWINETKSLLAKKHKGRFAYWKKRLVRLFLNFPNRSKPSKPGSSKV